MGIYGDKIVENQSGLLELKEAITYALDSPEGTAVVQMDGKDWVNVEQRDVMENAEQETPIGKFFNRAIGIIIGIWFFVLPLVPVTYMTEHAIFDYKGPECAIPEYLKPLPRVEFYKP